MESMYLLYAHDALTRVFVIEELTPEHLQDRKGTIGIYCDDTRKVEQRDLGDLERNSTPYLERGWCNAEIQWMCTKTDFYRYAPMPPTLFKAQSLEFTHRNDKKQVDQLQEQVFREQADKRTSLHAWALPEQQVKILVKSLEYFKNLQVLKISSDCAVSASLAQSLAESLEKLADLKEVCINGQDWSGNGKFQRAVEGLAKVSSLQTVNFSGCRIGGDHGAHAVAKVLKKWQDLRVIVLDSCGISQEGAMTLLAPLMACRHLQMVSLLGNERVYGIRDMLDHKLCSRGLEPHKWDSEHLLVWERKGRARSSVANLQQYVDRGYDLQQRDTSFNEDDPHKFLQEMKVRISGQFRGLRELCERAYGPLQLESFEFV